MPNPDLPRLSSSKVVQDGVFNSNTGALSLTLIYLGFLGGRWSPFLLLKKVICIGRK